MLRLLLVRGAACWATTRVALWVIQSGAPAVMGPPDVRLGALFSLWLTVICGSLIALDVARRRERVLFANHGVGVPTLLVFGGAPAAFAQLAIELLAAG